MINKLEKFVNIMFGAIFMALSLLIVTETLLRKLFNVSLQGIDELSGYALAIGACLAFSSALIGKSHMRIDLLYGKYPNGLKSVVNFLSILSLSVFSFFLSYICWNVVLETMEYQSTAPTAWGTPLIIPQSAWIAAILVFSITSLLTLVRAVQLVIYRQNGLFNREFGPKGVNDELKAEIQDLEIRTQKSHRSRSINDVLVEGEV